MQSEETESLIDAFMIAAVRSHVVGRFIYAVHTTIKLRYISSAFKLCALQLEFIAAGDGRWAARLAATRHCGPLHPPTIGHCDVIMFPIRERDDIDDAYHAFDFSRAVSSLSTALDERCAATVVTHEQNIN